MSETLSKLSEGLAAVVEQAGAGVVRVEARRRLPATGVIWDAEGLIVTASHVVRHEQDIAIGLPNGDAVVAQLIGRDQTTDLALLKAETSDLTALRRAGEEEIKVGHLALALGRPGRTVQATLGIVSALGGGWRTRMGGQVDRYLQTDVVMYPGFSGGPLVSVDGKLMGLNSSSLLPGVSMALPATTLARIVGGLRDHGRMRRGYLGVSTQRVHLPRNLHEELNQRSGLLVVSVEPDSPADAGGLTLGDTIIALGEATVQTHDDLLAELTGDKVDQKVPVKIVRGGAVQTLNVRISERP